MSSCVSRLLECVVAVLERDADREHLVVDRRDEHAAAVSRAR